MKAIRSGGIKSDVRYVTTAFSSARRCVNERKVERFEDRAARLCLTLATPSLWLGVALCLLEQPFSFLVPNDYDDMARIHRLSQLIIYIKRKILKPNKLVFRRGKLCVMSSEKSTEGRNQKVLGFSIS